MLKEVNQYIEDNQERFLEELFSLLRIPSVSSQSEHKQDMYRVVERWKELLLEAGVDKAEVMETAGHPVCYAERMINPDFPTVLVYGHADVMPADPLELWNTDPFEPVVKDGCIWARGANDDKGQGFMHAKAFEFMNKHDLLQCNMKFLIEGEEEIGSPSLGAFCEANKELLKADVILVSDTGMIDSDTPSLTTGLRGLAYWQVEVTGPCKDLHSGIFGGAVVNPVNALCQMISSLTDEHGKITVPGYYDDVLVVSEEERKLMAAAPFDEQEYKKNIGVKTLKGEKGYSPTEHTGIRPSMDVCGIWGGYTGEGAKTVLPSKAYAKISSRLVPNQDFNKIAELFTRHFEGIAPEGVTVKVQHLHGGQAYVCPIDLPAYRAAEKAYMDVYGKRPIPVRSGGSIPIISTFEEVLGIKSVLMGFGLDSDAIHSPNENYQLKNFYNGIRVAALCYDYFGKQK